MIRNRLSSGQPREVPLSSRKKEVLTTMPRRSTTTTSTWGGYRPGAGRKRTTAEPLISYELRLTRPQIAFLNHYGRGNLSAGARRVIDEAIARQQQLVTQSAETAPTAPPAPLATAQTDQQP